MGLDKDYREGRCYCCGLRYRFHNSYCVVIMESNYDVLRHAAVWMILLAYFVATQITDNKRVNHFGYATTAAIGLLMLMF